VENVVGTAFDLKRHGHRIDLLGGAEDSLEHGLLVFQHFHGFGGGKGLQLAQLHRELGFFTGVLPGDLDEFGAVFGEVGVGAVHRIGKSEIGLGLLFVRGPLGLGLGNELHEVKGALCFRVEVLFVFLEIGLDLLVGDFDVLREFGPVKAHDRGGVTLI